MINDFLDNIANDQYQKMLREIAHEDLKTVWKQMDEIEPLTPVNLNERKD
tara:strand:- start:737 stop:886 length:150 start_codon:yes stop_codon:yes gene_type:complete